MDAAWFVATAVAAVYLWRDKQQTATSFSTLQNYKDAKERVCTVDANNRPTRQGHWRWEMRTWNLWHRATYIFIRMPNPRQPDNDFVLVQRRSRQKDYCPGKLDPLPGGVVGFGETGWDNAVREVYEEMGIVVNTQNTLTRLCSFAYQDDRVRVWGELYDLVYRGGGLDTIVIQESEVEHVLCMTRRELQELMETSPDEFMPDALYGLQLYFQRTWDLRVQRRLLKGYSSGNLDHYQLRPPPEAIFFDCDDTLYFDGWKVADLLTRKIDAWCVQHGLPEGKAYELYKEYGTCLRGLLAEGYLETTEEAIDGFLQDVHDLPIDQLLKKDDELRQLLLDIDPSIPKYIFTASVKDHAHRCLKALGIDDLFVDIIDVKICKLETKHSKSAFETAMKFANVEHPERCVFFDDSVKNIRAAREMGWRSVLVGRVGRDCGTPISSEHAELEIDSIHDVPRVLPELFRQGSRSKESSFSS